MVAGWTGKDGGTVPVIWSPHPETEARHRPEARGPENDK